MVSRTSQSSRMPDESALDVLHEPNPEPDGHVDRLEKEIDIKNTTLAAEGKSSSNNIGGGAVIGGDVGLEDEEEEEEDPLVILEEEPLTMLLPRGASRMRRSTMNRLGSIRDMRRQSAANYTASRIVAVRSSQRNIMNTDGKFEAAVVEEEEMVTALTDDIYSLLFVADLGGRAFCFAACTFAAQMSILVLVLLDLVDFSNDPPTSNNGTINRMYIPAGVPLTVTIAQAIGIFLSVCFLLDKGDLIRGCEHLSNGYQEHILETAPSATRGKWFLAGLLQTCVGIMMAIDLFVLSMQSTDVLGFCLNYAALHFVQEIDDVAFALASVGLFSRGIQQECLGVGEVMIPAEVKKRTLWMRKILVAALFIGLYAAFFVVMGYQWAGVYRCKSVYIQFGDAFGAEMAYYSGRFSSKNSWQGRPYYTHESGELRLSYSEAHHAWLFFKLREGDLTYPFLVSSSETDSYDLTDVADQTWYANMPAGVKPIDWLVLTCADCNIEHCWPEHGTCVNDMCVCNDPSRFGLSCEIKTPEECNYYALDYRTRGQLPSLKGGSFFMETEFARLKDQYDGFENFTVYDRPLFFHLKMHALLVFSGRRWIMFGSQREILEDQCPCNFGYYMNETDIYSMTERDALFTIRKYSNFVPLYFSSPMDYSTPSDGPDFVSLTWYIATNDIREAFDEISDGANQEITSNVILGYNSSLLGFKPDAEYPIPAKFLCSECHSDSDCHNGGVCEKSHGSGECACSSFYTGRMCEAVRSCHEIGCWNNGVCDDNTGVCTDCDKGSAGNLCQFPSPTDFDPFFCATPNADWVDVEGYDWPYRNECANNQKCNVFEQRCECEAPFFGGGCVNSTRASCNDTFFDPCLNGGYCDYDRYASTPICTCPEDYGGDFCEEVTLTIIAYDDDAV